MVILIAGSRSWTNHRIIQEYIHSLPESVTIITGGAKGADSIAHEIAKRAGLQTKVYLADWNKYGRGAGMIRNKEMIADADMVCCFWDGESTGTKNTIDLAINALHIKRITIVKGI